MVGGIWRSIPRAVVDAPTLPTRSKALLLVLVLVLALVLVLVLALALVLVLALVLALALALALALVLALALALALALVLVLVPLLLAEGGVVAERTDRASAAPPRPRYPGRRRNGPPTTPSPSRRLPSARNARSSHTP